MIELNIDRVLSGEELLRKIMERAAALPAEKQAALLEWMKREFPDTDGN